ncbi:MAG: hypothetical protein AAB217_01920, partial [Chloroflexota bacterium]
MSMILAALVGAADVAAVDPRLQLPGGGMDGPVLLGGLLDLGFERRAERHDEVRLRQVPSPV